MKWPKYAAPDAHLGKLRCIAFAGKSNDLDGFDADVMRWRKAASEFHSAYGYLPDRDIAGLVAFADAVARGAAYTETTDEWRASEWERFERDTLAISEANLGKLFPGWEPCDGVPTDAPAFFARTQWVRQELARIKKEPRTKPATKGAVEQHLKRCRKAHETLAVARRRKLLGLGGYTAAA